MPRDTRTRRLTRPGPGVAEHHRSGQATTALPLVSLLARTSRLTDLLPGLHQHALDATGGVSSLLFEINPRNGVLQATSGFGLDALCTDPWTPGETEQALVDAAFE